MWVGAIGQGVFSRYDLHHEVTCREVGGILKLFVGIGNQWNFVQKSSHVVVFLGLENDLSCRILDF